MRGGGKENGNILVSSLLVMLAMNFLAVALVQTSSYDIKIADIQEADTSNLYFADNCFEEAKTWLRSLTAPPDTLPYTITRNNVSHLYNGLENQQSVNYLNKFSYNCTVNSINVLANEATDSGKGNNVETNEAYGLAGNTNPKYYYSVVSNAVGPNNSQKQLSAIISVRF